ncbi:Dyp-type peroxidase [Enemella evansiae]|uniref:Dyp-type peroxidase n=1 Tax=Enemella evansiae TaxID=2016499 RepID=UPI000B97029C|nr:Dyp-type peroxidase [Enemella evansiae]OYO07757.1 peroxidase [Enemella evansiae]TDO86021.1 putative iron-dependent peroxidase [Enemella evansiae]
MTDPTQPEPQAIDAPMTTAAAFLVLTVGDGDDATTTARGVVAGIDDLIKDVRIRANGRPFTCNVGISDHVWDRLTGNRPKPKELKPFTEIKGAKHTAVATPGDLLFHIRADSTDLVIEFEKLLLEALGDSVSTVDDVAGFRYFDGRDLLEFIDGTANPDGLALPAATLVGEEDEQYAGGSYVVIQKYLHDLGAWRKQSTETQEQIIGRTKPDNVELPDAGADQQKSHKTLCTITDEQGEHDILRDNMPFATPGEGVYGTFFIGYSRHLWVTEKMLERMFVGDPPPLYDKILDFSKAVTGVTLFVPPRGFLKSLSD